MFGMEFLYVFCITIMFLVKTNKIHEINWISKTMLILACLHGMQWTSHYIVLVFTDKDIPPNARIVGQIFGSVPQAIFFGTMFRFVRAQVQLRA